MNYKPMHFRIFRIGIVVLLVLMGHLTALHSASAKNSRDRIALIIGNSAYQYASRLANPGNDALAMAEALSAAGYEIYGGKPLLDANREEMGRAIRAFGKELKTRSVGLFYFAGHGAQIDGNNYLFPVTAKLEAKGDEAWELVNFNSLLDAMEEADKALKIVILDACRNNPLLPARVMRGAGTGLAETKAPRGTWISYAAGPGQQAIDAMGAHSPYTQALLDAAKEPGLTLYQAFNKVALRVDELTQGKQEPWDAHTAIDAAEKFYPFLPPVVSTVGILELHVSPANAILRLGDFAGPADGFRRELHEGQHEYEITAEGFETRHGTLDITAGKEKIFEIALTKSLLMSPPPTPSPKTGTLEIDAKPPGATLTFDGVDLGPAGNFRQEVAAGKHQIRLAAEGFEARSELVEVIAGHEKALVFALTPTIVTPPPLPVPTTGILELQVATSGATVHVDGKPMGLAKGFRRELAPGEHQIEIAADGYEPVKQTVSIAPGIERSLVLSLAAIPQTSPAPPSTTPPEPEKDTGFLIVATEPAAAQISIDGTRAGTGSARREVKPGEHVVVASGKGLVEQRIMITVDRGEHVQVPLQLARIPPPQPLARPVPRREALRAPQVYTPPAVSTPVYQVPATPRTPAPAPVSPPAVYPVEPQARRLPLPPP